MAAWKLWGWVLLVVLPGGGLLLLALAAYRAWQRAGHSARVKVEFARAPAALARWVRAPLAPAARA